jgi:hypothetical protein
MHVTLLGPRGAVTTHTILSESMMIRVAVLMYSVSAAAVATQKIPCAPLCTTTESITARTVNHPVGVAEFRWGIKETI